jgi:hypothetical protein
VSGLKVFRRTATCVTESGRSDSFDASSVRVIRAARITDVGCDRAGDRRWRKRLLASATRVYERRPVSGVRWLTSQHRHASPGTSTASPRILHIVHMLRQVNAGARVSGLKVFRRTATWIAESGRSDSVDASSVRVIRAARITDAGVTAQATGVGRSGYSRRRRECMSGGRFPACAGWPLSTDMPAAARALLRRASRQPDARMVALCGHDRYKASGTPKRMRSRRRSRTRERGRGWNGGTWMICVG